MYIFSVNTFKPSTEDDYLEIKLNNRNQEAGKIT